MKHDLVLSAGLIQETFGSRAKESVRYAIKKETDAFDLQKLRKAPVFCLRVL